MDTPNKEDVFKYLDELREGGVTNMFSAQHFIMGEFYIGPKEASTLLTEWMKTFSERHPKE